MWKKFSFSTANLAIVEMFFFSLIRVNEVIIINYKWLLTSLLIWTIALCPHRFVSNIFSIFHTEVTDTHHQSVLRLVFRWLGILCFIPLLSCSSVIDSLNRGLGSFSTTSLNCSRSSEHGMVSASLAGYPCLKFSRLKLITWRIFSLQKSFSSS